MNNQNGFLPNPVNYRDLLFYKKATILYDMTYWYQDRYLVRGDRTKDQMEQAARSGKQNVVEGTADGMTSIEMEIKLLNTARGSLLELLEDYEDQLRSRRLEQWTIEEFCNVALTLIHQADRGMLSYLKKVERTFLEEGGIKERMTAARKVVRGY